MKRVALVILFLVLVPASQAFGAASDRSDSVWKLPLDMYPKNATLQHFAPTNKNMQFVFATDHSTTYNDLGRINGRGWLDQAVRSDNGEVSYAMGYGVSYYPSDDLATAALDDVASTLHQTQLLVDVGTAGHIYVGTAGGGYYLIFAAFGAGSVTVEQACFVRLSMKAKYGRMVEKACAKQRDALAEILAQFASPTSTPTAGQ